MNILKKVLSVSLIIFAGIHPANSYAGLKSICSFFLGDKKVLPVGLSEAEAIDAENIAAKNKIPVVAVIDEKLLELERRKNATPFTVQLPDPRNTRTMEGNSILFYRGELPTESQIKEMRVDHLKYFRNDKDGVVMVYSERGEKHRNLDTYVIPPGGIRLGGVRIFAADQIENSTFYHTNGIAVMEAYFNITFADYIPRN